MKLTYEYLLKNKSSLEDHVFASYENYQSSLQKLKNNDTDKTKRSSSA